jgi:hypothetical protein
MFCTLHSKDIELLDVSHNIGYQCPYANAIKLLVHLSALPLKIQVKLNLMPGRVFNEYLPVEPRAATEAFSVQLSRVHRFYGRSEISNASTSQFHPSKLPQSYNPVASLHCRMNACLVGW